MTKQRKPRASKRTAARIRHIKWLTGQLPPPNYKPVLHKTEFDRIAQHLFVKRLKPSLQELFPDRSEATLRDWRRGRYKAPQWAIDRLLSVFDDRIREAIEAKEKALSGALKEK